MILLIGLLLAQGGEYPKVVHKNGQTCVQTLNAAGAVEESCRAGEGEYKVPAGGARTADADEPRPSRVRPAPPPTEAMTMHWVEAKRNWALAFKIGAVGGYAAMLVSLLGAAVAGGSNLEHAADPYLVNFGVSAALGLGFTLLAVLFDFRAYDELAPSKDD
jgi:hypothetical protein